MTSALLFVGLGVWKQLVGLFLLCLGVGLTTMVIVISMRRVDQLNELLPPEEQFYQLLWGPEKKSRFERTYRKHFPNSWAPYKEIGLLIVAVSCDIAGLWLLLPHF